MQFRLETVSFITALVALQLIPILYVWGFIKKAYSKDNVKKTPARFVLPVLFLAWLALAASLIIRAIQAGHVLFMDMYEFTASFYWGVMFARLLFQWRLKTKIFGADGTFKGEFGIRS